MSQDKEIVEKLKTGKDNEFIDLLYKYLLPKLKKYITSNRGGYEDVKDVFQEVVFVTYRKIKLEKFHPETDLVNYMFVMGKNYWIRKAVKQQRNDSLNDLDREHDLRDDKMGALNQMIVKEKNQASMDILNKLGDKCAELLNLRIYQELPLDEITGLMSLRNSDVTKSMIYRCKQKLKSKIKTNKGFQQLLGIA